MRIEVPTSTTFILGQTEHHVEFDVARLLKIEDAMQESVFSVAQLLADTVPVRRELDGRDLGDDEIKGLDKADADRLVASDAEQRRSLSACRLGLIAGFMAACVDVPLDELVETHRLGSLFKPYQQLAAAFFEAMNQMNGTDEEESAEGKAIAGSRPGEPGPASSSGCHQTSSPASAQASSEISGELGESASSASTTEQA